MNPGLPPEHFGQDFLLAIGEVYGIRAWGVRDGKLTAAFDSRFVWEPGVNTAVCHVDTYKTGWMPWVMKPTYFGWGCAWMFQAWNLEKRPKPHTDAPREECTCGFYAYSQAKSSMYGTVRGVVRITGRTLVGTKGYRFEKGEIVALLDPERVTDTAGVPWRRTALEAIKTNYPSIPLFSSEADMLEAFPLTEPEK